MSVEITIPSPGESVNEVTVGTWLKNDGDWVEQDEAICEIESDKATLEVGSPAAGVLHASADVGTELEVGSVLGTIDTSAKKAAKKKKTSGKKKAATPVAAAPDSSDGDAGTARASTMARKLAEEKGVNLDSVPRQRTCRQDHEGRCAFSSRGVDPSGGRKPDKSFSNKYFKADSRRATATTCCHWWLPWRQAGTHDEAAPEGRGTTRRLPAERRHADHLQRGGHECGHEHPQHAQGRFREEAWGPTGIHELLPEGFGVRSAELSQGERLHHRQGDPVPRLLRHRCCRGNRSRPGGTGHPKRGIHGLRTAGMDDRGLRTASTGTDSLVSTR